VSHGDEVVDAQSFGDAKNVVGQGGHRQVAQITRRGADATGIDCDASETGERERLHEVIEIHDRTTEGGMKKYGRADPFHGDVQFP
jgi:hypothetical protein